MDKDVDTLAYRLGGGVELLDLTGSNMSLKEVVRAVTGQDTFKLHSLGMNQAESASVRVKHHVCEIKGHHSASTRKLSELEPLLCTDLKQGQRHSGKVIHLTVLGKTSREESIGTYYDTQDSTGRQVTLWSLVFDPLGDFERVWPKDLAIAVKEPLFDQPPKTLGKGRPRGLMPAICVHHPQDISYYPGNLKNHTGADTDIEDMYKQYLRLGNEALLSKDLFTAKAHFSTASAALINPSIYGEVTCDEPSKASLSSHFDLLQRLAFIESELGRFEDSLYYVKVAVIVADTHPELTKQKRAQWQNLLLMGAKAALKLGKLEDALHICSPGDVAGNTKLQQCYEHLQEKKKELHGDYDWASIVQQIDAGKSEVDVLSFTANVTVRQSPLAGKGLFTVLDRVPGELVMCEKALALGTVSGQPANTDVQGLIPGETVLSKKVSLLQQLAKKFLLNPQTTSEAFSLHSGDKLKQEFKSSCDRTACIFNTYHAASIIKHNAHVINTGLYSDRHDEMDPEFTNKPVNERRKPYTTSCGLWPKVSMANHSCYPNAVWSWMGDLIVVRAGTYIKAGEEILLSYVPSNMPYEKRKARLIESYGFECKCKLCIVEGSANKEEEQIKAHVDKLFRQEEAFIIGPKEEALNTPVEYVTKALCAMSALPAYKGIPIPMLALPFFQLGLMCLGPMQQWYKVREKSIALAMIAFSTCLTTGLGVRPAEAKDQPAELIFTHYTEVKRIGVFAFMVLAELNFSLAKRQWATTRDIRKYQQKSLKFQRCAKRLYLICYGEDVTFENHHQGYACKELWIASGLNK